MAYELFVDSFDTSTVPVPTRWLYSATYTVIAANEGRRSTAALRMWPSNTAASTAQTYEKTPSTRMVCGFSMRLPAPLNEAFSIIFQNSATGLATITLGTDLKLRCTLAGTTYVSTNAMLAGSTNYIEAGIVIGDSGSLEVRVNGSSAGWLDLTGVDTKPGADTTATNILLYYPGHFSNQPIYIDDFYLTYGDELKWLGDIRVDAMTLTGNSTPQDWTPDTGNAWERLNNSSDGYITGTTIDDESLFALADYTAQTTAIHGVQVSAYARKTDAGSRSMAIQVKSDTTTDVGDTIALGDTTTEYRHVWLTDPDTADAWADGGIDALEVGVKVMD